MMQDMAPILMMDIGLNMEMVVKSVNKESFETQLQIKQLKMKMSSQGESENFDSSKSDSELSEEEKKMKKQIAPALEMVVHQTINKSGKVISTKMIPEVKEAAAFLQNQFTNMEYPKEEVSVGSTWSFGQNMNGMSLESKYKVTKITNDKVYATIVGDLKGTTDAKMNGELVIDRSTGMMSSMNFDLSASAMGMSLGMKIKLTTKKI